MDLALLESMLADLGQPAFRAKQVWEWTARGAASYEEMTNLPAALRVQLEERVPLSSLRVEHEALSFDGTEKALFHTVDGRPLEAVLMRYRGAKDSASLPNPSRSGRRSVCLSSQSGCPLTCTFCATGTMKFGRNLTSSEILDQALHFRRNEALDHCVFMGMGEPLLNLDNVLGACERLPDIGIHPSSTTISTVGWVPGIERLTERDGPTIRLALSLHAPDDELRSQLMPVNDRYPLADVLAACRRWHEHRRRRVYIEYLMLAGVNDSQEQALALARVLTPHEAFKVNLIPYNFTPGGGAQADRWEGAHPDRWGGAQPDSRSGEHRTRLSPAEHRTRLSSGLSGSSREAIGAFRDTLHDNGVPATVRLTRGRDIDASCGQLAVSTAAA